MISPVLEAVLAEELPALEARAARAGWGYAFDRASLILSLTITGARTSDRYHLQGDLNGYKAVPPAWTFLEPDTGIAGTYRAFPARASGLSDMASVFTEYRDGAGVAHPVICLPCNRLCFKENKGLHSEWTVVNWLLMANQYATLVEMVNRIVLDLQASSGPWVPR
jgi:hypothetical protein